MSGISEYRCGSCGKPIEEGYALIDVFSRELFCPPPETEEVRTESPSSCGRRYADSVRGLSLSLLVPIATSQSMEFKRTFAATPAIKTPQAEDLRLSAETAAFPAKYAHAAWCEG